MKNKLILIASIFCFIIIRCVLATTNDAKAYYACDANGTFTDSSGFGNTGTIFGATFMSNGKINGMYNFTSASKNNVSIAPSNSMNLTNAFSISLWYNVPDTNDNSFVWKGIVAGYNLQLGVLATKYYGYITPNGVNCEAYGLGSAIKTNAWTHLVWVRRGSVMEFWENNVNTFNKTSCTTNDFNASMFNPGRMYLGYASATGQWLHGSIDEVAYYNYSLSNAQISELYASGAGYNPYAATGGSPCTYSGSGNWLIENVSCNITANSNLFTNTLTISNATVIINASIINYTIYMIEGGSTVTKRSVL
jgi:hypothetical protein